MGLWDCGDVGNMSALPKLVREARSRMLSRGGIRTVEHRMHLLPQKIGDQAPIRSQRGVKVVIAQHLRRAAPLPLDAALYRWRHLIENIFGPMNFNRP